MSDDDVMVTCPGCAGEVPAGTLADGSCPSCRDAGATSVRPPDHGAEETVIPVPDDVDPLAGWDLPGPIPQTALPPPPTWAIMTGAAGFAGMVGVASGLAAGSSGVRRGLGWAALGAGAAAAALRVWELEPEAAEWARRLSSRTS